MFFELFICLLLLVLVASALWYWTIPSNLPPGPKGLPFVGLAFRTYSAKSLHDNLLKWRQQYGPVFKFYVMNRLVVVLGNYESIHEAFVKQGDAYAGRQPFFSFQAENQGLLDSEGEAWKVRRRFSLSTLRNFGFGKSSLEPKISEELNHLISKVETYQGQAVDLHADVLATSLNVIFCLSLGRRLEADDETFQNFFNQFMTFQDLTISCLTPFSVSRLVCRIFQYSPIGKYLEKQALRFQNMLKTAAAESSSGYETDQEPTNYVEAFMQMQRRQPDNEHFSDLAMITCLGSLLGAGAETTSTTVLWVLLYLAKYPEVQQKMYDELRAQGDDQCRVSYADRSRVPYTEAAIMEVQRCINLTPHALLHRVTVANKLCGYDIPEDTLVVPIMSSCLNDDRSFADPDQFKPERFLRQNVNEDVSTRFAPFGIGKRSCMGESLAKMELFVLITGLVARFEFSIPPDESVSVKDGQLGLITRFPPKHKFCAKLRP